MLHDLMHYPDCSRLVDYVLSSERCGTASDIPKPASKRPEPASKRPRPGSRKMDVHIVQIDGYIDTEALIPSVFCRTLYLLVPLPKKPESCSNSKKPEPVSGRPRPDSKGYGYLYI